MAIAKPKGKPKPKKVAVKKVVVTPKIATLNPTEKIAFARGVHTTCVPSAEFQASQSCQAAMSLWMTKTDALDKNQQDIKAKESELAHLHEQETVCIIEYDDAANAFAGAVQSTAKGDPLVVAAMGMKVRATGQRTTDLLVPAGLRIIILKSGEPRLEWDAVAGAVLYTAQMSVSPPTDASWGPLYGEGKSRALPPLTPEQHYVFRVCAVASNGKSTAWSEMVSFVGK